MPGHRCLLSAGCKYRKKDRACTFYGECDYWIVEDNLFAYIRYPKCGVKMSTNYDASNITTFRGDDLAFDVVFEDCEEVPVDVTGWTLFFTIKVNRHDTDSTAVFAKEYHNTFNPTAGLITVFMSHSETDVLNGTYFFCIQIKKADGTIQTITRGGISFLQDVTRRIV
jgi:hypothetical protein